MEGADQRGQHARHAARPRDADVVDDAAGDPAGTNLGPHPRVRPGHRPEDPCAHIPEHTLQGEAVQDGMHEADRLAQEVQCDQQQ